MLFKLSNLNSNLALTLGYLNPALNNWALAKTLVFTSLIPRRSLSPRCPREVWERAGEFSACISR